MLAWVSTPAAGSNQGNEIPAAEAQAIFWDLVPGAACAILFVLLVCASVLGGTAWRVWTTRTLALQDGWTSSANMAHALADQAHTTVEVADVLVAGLVERVEVDGTGGGALARLHQVMVAKVAGLPSINNLFVFAPDGVVLASSLPGLTVGGGDREYFTFHRTHAERGAHIGPPVQNRANGRWTLMVSRRFDRPDGAFGGVALAAIDFDTFSTFYAKINIGAHGSIALVSDEDLLLVRVPAKPESIGADLSATSVQRAYHEQGPAGSVQAISKLDGVMRLYSFRQVDRYPLVVFVALSEADILANWTAETWTILAASGAAVLVLGLLGWRLTGQIRFRHRAEAAVRDSELRYRLLADTSTDLIIQLGPDFRRVYVSPASWTLLGYDPQELLGRYPRDLAHPDDWPAIEGVLAGITAGSQAAPFTFRARHKDGSYVWVEGSGSKLSAEGGCVISMRDATQRKQAEARLHEANDQLQRMVMLDGLTGIANRRCFDLALQREFRRAARAETPLALLLIDVDRFKSYNDTYGHPAGDRCLRAIAGALGQQVRRASDLAARYGGEEFVMLLPEIDVPGAMALAECAREAVRQLGVVHCGSTDLVATVSIGVAVIWPQREGDTPDELVQLADAALYQAKAEGRDRAFLRTARAVLPDGGSRPTGFKQTCLGPV